MQPAFAMFDNSKTSPQIKRSAPRQSGETPRAVVILVNTTVFSNAKWVFENQGEQINLPGMEGALKWQ